MQQISQPATHSILRNSQSRRQSSRQDQQHHNDAKETSIQNNNYRHYNHHNNAPTINNNNISYSQHDDNIYKQQFTSSNHNHPQQHNLYNNKQYHPQINHIHFNYSQVIPKQRHQNIVVCKSLPKTKPKYSFTFGQKPLINVNHHQQINQTPTKNNTYQHQQRLSLTHSSHQHSNKRAQSQRKLSISSQNIRKDIDICLYTITDRLKQQNQEEQEHFKQAQQIASNKLGSPQQYKYKPSYSQIKKNKRLFLDRSIHRIHPDIVEEYIETVYRDYNIPNPISKTGREEQLQQAGQNYNKQFNQKQEYVTKNQLDTSQKGVQKQNSVNFISKQHQNLQKQQNLERNQFIQNIQIRSNQIEIKSQQKTKWLQQIKQQQQIITQQQRKLIKSLRQSNLHQRQQKKQYPQQEKIASEINQNQQQQNHIIQPVLEHNSNNYIDSQYILHNKKNIRRKNLISLKQSQRKQKKKFLNLTLSKQKDTMIKTKTFESPIKQKLVLRQEENKQSPKKKSVRKNSSKKKIEEIKKNISNWRDSDHQYAERYSYLESPYEMIRGNQRNRQESAREVNVMVRPFEQMTKLVIENEVQHQVMGKAIRTVTTQYITNPNISQYQTENDSKYIQSFFVNSQTEITEQFRYCPLCELQVLTANLVKHQQKCIGWIDDNGNLIMFKNLYMMEDQKLGKLIVAKIAQLKLRVETLVQKLKLKQQKTAKEERQTVDRKILKTAQDFICHYKQLQQNPINQTSKQLFSSTYNRLSRISHHSQSLVLLQETKKLYWFVGLLNGYQSWKKLLERNGNNKRPITYQSQQIIKPHSVKQSVSTMAKHNLSVTFIQETENERHVAISQFIQGRRSNY